MVEELVLTALEKLGYNQDEYLKQLEKKYEEKINGKKSDVEKLSLERSLNFKLNQIDNLVDKLSYDDEISDILTQKIKTLKKECTEIKNKLASLELSKEKAEIELFNIDITKELLNECKIIKILPREKQKKIIDRLIKVVYWYGTGKNNGKVKVEFIGTTSTDTEIIYTKEELHAMLQNCSHSMSCMNSSATFKKVFTNIDEKISTLYTMLPEDTFAQKVYKLRKLHNLSQKEFSLKIGIGYTTLCRYELDSHANASKENLLKICKYFDLDLKYFD
jgi:DNA-binding XRE family transcriptional regulator